MKAYITFGQVHVHNVNGKTFDKDCVAVIEAPTYAAARQQAFDYFGNKWHMCYAEEDWTEDKLRYFPRGLLPVDGAA